MIEFSLRFCTFSIFWFWSFFTFNSADILQQCARYHREFSLEKWLNFHWVSVSFHSFDFDLFSYSILQTSSNNVQDIIESRVEKRTKGVYVPLGGKRLLTFLDDFNMPLRDTFGSQPPLELIRLWLDYGFWYDRQKQTVKNIKDMFLLAAMGPPGGGRTNISRRLQSRFNLINMTFPAVSRCFFKKDFQKFLRSCAFDESSLSIQKG